MIVGTSRLFPVFNIVNDTAINFLTMLGHRVYTFTFVGDFEISFQSGYIKLHSC